MKRIEKFIKDEMTPVQRKKAIDTGRPFDRLPCLPFLGEFKCRVAGISIPEFWHDAHKMAEAEIRTFNRFGIDRLMIGPNSYGIAEALGAHVVYPKHELPYIEKPYITDYKNLETMEPLVAERNERLRIFLNAAEMLGEAVADVVPAEASIGGPFTVASYLRGTEQLLRDLRKCPEGVHSLMRIVTETQKAYVKAMSDYEIGVAMADPVANPELLGPKMYEEFVYPYMKELTEYVSKSTGRQVSLHMCGKTYRIWEYLCTYTLNELSLDNGIDLMRAKTELGGHVPIAGNVDPVNVVMNGSKEDIFAAVKRCIEIGRDSLCGYVIATGCEVPWTTEFQKVDWFMEAGRGYGRQLL